VAKIGILNDYQGTALASADWTALQDGNDIEVFRKAMDEDTCATTLRDFDVLCLMRERTPFPRSLLSRLPNLKLLVTTGMGNRSVDMDACKERGITVCGTRGGGNGTAELTWGLLIGAARNIPAEDAAMREGRWQDIGVGYDLIGKTIGCVGLGNIGARVAKVALAFGMNVIAWSQNLTAERAAEAGATLVTKEELFSQADYITVHYVLSDRTRGMVGAADIARMKPTAFLINTSRGPLVDEKALVEALQQKRIAGAGLDVYDQEPLPKDHPLLKLDNVVLTPHIGFVSKDSYHGFFRDTVEDVAAFLRGEPVRVLGQ
jgi:phosphoglycerate dehydrogenase-like enzyme